MVNLIIGRFLYAAVGVMSIRLATTILEPSQYGLMALALTIVGMLSMIIAGSSGAYLNLKTRKKFRLGQYKSVYDSTIQFLALAAVILLIPIIFFLYMLKISSSIIEGIVLALIILTIFVSSNATNNFISALTVMGYQKYFLIISILNQCAILIFAFAATKYFGATSLMWLLGVSAANISMALTTYVIFFKKYGRKRHIKVWERERLKKAYQFAAPLAVSIALTWVYFNGYKFLLQNEVNPDKFGYIMAGVGISVSIISASETFFSVLYSPEFYRNLSSSNVSIRQFAWAEYSEKYLMSLFYILAGLTILSTEIGKIFFSSDFQSASQYIIFGTVLEFARIIYQCAALNSNVNEKTSRLLFPNLASMFVVFFVVLLEIFQSILLSLVFGYLIGLLTFLLALSWRSKENSVSLSFRWKSNVPSLILLIFCIILYPAVSWGNSSLTLVLGLKMALIGFLAISFIRRMRTWKS
jgi:O-antigen/teichoic acid export membrane protein